MKTVTRVIVFAAVVVMVTSAIASSAFTTATLERDTNIDVVADGSGIIALTDGTSGDVVTVENGSLSIDFAVGSASGVNVDSVYELGDSTDPASATAFNITNQDGVQHTISLDYTVNSGDGVGDGESNVEFLVFDSSGSLATSEDEESGTGSFSAGPGESFAVVVVVDTTVGGVDQTSDLSGLLTISAS